MALVGNATVRFATETSDYTKGVEKVKESNKSFLKDLNNTFGKASTFGKLLKIGAGSGAIFALGKVASEFDTVTAHIVEMNKKLREGQITGGEFANGIVTSIPVIGHVVKGFENISELITHANEKLEKQREILKTAAEERKKNDEEAKKTSGKVATDTPDFEHAIDLQDQQNSIAEARLAGNKLVADIAEINLKQNEALTKQVTEIAKPFDEAIEAQKKILNQDRTGLTDEEIWKFYDDANAEIDRLLKQKQKLIGDAQLEASRARNLAVAQSEQDIIDKSLDDWDAAIEKGVDANSDALKKHNEDVAKAARDAWDETVNALDKFKDESKKLTESVATPLEKLKQSMKDIDFRAALPAFLGGLDPETAKRLRAKARSEIDKTSSLSEIGNATANVRIGSTTFNGAAVPSKIDRTNKLLEKIDANTTAPTGTQTAISFALAILPGIGG